MKREKQPQCYVIAGPNGAGKTTFALKYLPLIASCYDFINADEIARGLSPLDFEAGLLKAGKIFLENLNQRIRLRKDFAFETTLSGRMYLPRIVEWRKAGWFVTLFYLYIPNAEFSAQRVRERVLKAAMTFLRTILSDATPEVSGTYLPMPMSVMIRYASTTPGTKLLPSLKSVLVNL